MATHRYFPGSSKHHPAWSAQRFEPMNALKKMMLESGSYQLQSSGRYAQSPAYLQSLAAQCGLEERTLHRTLIRREGRGHAEGWLALFSKTA